jgi:hypothetical protein
MVGYKPDQSKDIRSGRVKREQDGWREIRRVMSQKDTHTLPSAEAVKCTVADLVRAYLAIKKTEANAKIYAKEEQFASLRIIPRLGSIKQEKLTPADVTAVSRGCWAGRCLPVPSTPAGTLLPPT